MAHWRSLIDSATLGVGDFPDGVTDWVVTIAAVKSAHVQYADGKQRKGAITFAGVAKPYAAGATFMAGIAKLYGDDPARWVGQRVTLYATKTKAFGEEKDCIRVRPRIPAADSATPTPYDHAATLAALASASSLDEVGDIRAALNAQRPGREYADELRAALAAATERVKSAHGTEQFEL